MSKVLITFMIVFIIIVITMFAMMNDTLRNSLKSLSPKSSLEKSQEDFSDNMRIVSHSEYWSGERGQILTTLLDYQGVSITDANCTVDILYPDRSYFKQDEQAIFDIDSYYYTFITPDIEGVYQYKVSCLYQNGNKERSSMNSFHLSPALNFEKIMYDNLSNQITNLSNLEEVHFAQTTYNLTQIKQDTEYIRTTVDYVSSNMQTQAQAQAQYNSVVQKLDEIANFCGTNYTSQSLLCQWVNQTRDSIEDINETIIIMNQSIVTIINQTQYIINQTNILINFSENLVNEINITVNQLIQENLVDVMSNISDMQNDLEILKNTTNISLDVLIQKIDSLQQNFTDLRSDISLLRNEALAYNNSISLRLDNLDTEVNGVKEQVIQIENKLDCNNTVNVVCDMIQELIVDVIQVNETSNYIREYLESIITEYLLNITNITVGVGGYTFKGPSEIDLLIDLYDGDVTRYGGNVDFVVELISPEDSNGFLELYINDVLNTTLSSSILWTTLLMSQGTYIIKGRFTGDGNYSPTTKYHKLIILSTNNIPIVNLINPINLSSINLPYNITFDISDDSDLSVDLMLFSNNVYNMTIAGDISKNDTSYYWNTSFVSGFYDIVLRACEIGTEDLFCINDTHSIYLNISCIPNWVLIYDACQINNTQFVVYNDTDSCGISVNLPADNGTYVYCDYCSEDIEVHYIPEICPENQTRLRYYMDNNYDTCCLVTNLVSDCSIYYYPYLNETVNCTYLSTDITLNVDDEPYLNDRIDIMADINISNATKCWSYVKSENGVLQTSPRKTVYSDSLFFAKKSESREYFTPVNGRINAYYTDENLIPSKQFILGVSCSLDDGSVVSGEQYITPRYDDLRKVTARTVWGVTEIPVLLFVSVLVLIVIGLVIYAWKK